MIRLAEARDAQRMMEIYNEAIADKVHANCDVLQDDLARFSAKYFFGSDKYVSMVSESTTAGVVGWGGLKTFSARPHDSSMAEVAVYIARSNRSAGLGIHLTRKLTEHARSVGLHSLVAIILGNNRASLRGCKFCGFEERIRLRELAMVYGCAEDIVWMQLMLHGGSEAAEEGLAALDRA